MNTVTISKEKIKAVPTYYLKGRAATKLDKLVGRGLKDYRTGKTKTIKSLADFNE